MSPFNLQAEAQRCRAQAECFDGQERKLLLKIADLFERISARENGRRSIDRTRCW